MSRGGSRKCRHSCVCGRHRKCKPGCECGRHDAVMKRRYFTFEIPDADLAWLAGILEGEGSFMIRKNGVGGKIYLYPTIAVSMTDQDVIDRVAAFFGTSVYEMPKYRRAGYANPKQQWKATLTGSRAAAMMQALLPWMGRRRSQKIAEILTEYSQFEPSALRRQLSCSIAAAKRPRVAGRFMTDEPDTVAIPLFSLEAM